MSGASLASPVSPIELGHDAPSTGTPSVQRFDFNTNDTKTTNEAGLICLSQRTSCFFLAFFVVFVSFMFKSQGNKSDALKEELPPYTNPHRD